MTILPYLHFVAEHLETDHSLLDKSFIGGKYFLELLNFDVARIVLEIWNPLPNYSTELQLNFLKCDSVLFSLLLAEASFPWYSAGLFSSRPPNTREKRPLLTGNVVFLLFYIPVSQDSFYFRSLHREYKTKTLNSYHRISRSKINYCNVFVVRFYTLQLITCTEHKMFVSQALPKSIIWVDADHTD